MHKCQLYLSKDIARIILTQDESVQKEKQNANSAKTANQYKI